MDPSFYVFLQDEPEYKIAIFPYHGAYIIFIHVLFYHRLKEIMMVDIILP